MICSTNIVLWWLFFGNRVYSIQYILLCLFVIEMHFYEMLINCHCFSVFCCLLSYCSRICNVDLLGAFELFSGGVWAFFGGVWAFFELFFVFEETFTHSLVPFASKVSHLDRFGYFISFSTLDLRVVRSKVFHDMRRKSAIRFFNVIQHCLKRNNEKI